MGRAGQSICGDFRAGGAGGQNDGAGLSNGRAPQGTRPKMRSTRNSPLHPRLASENSPEPATRAHLANPGPGVAAHEDTDHEFPGGRRPLLSAVPAACLQGLLGFVLIEMLSM